MITRVHFYPSPIFNNSETLGNTKTKYYDDGQLYTNTLNSIKLSRLDKPIKENYVEVIAKPNEVSEIGKYDAYYIVEETVSPININFVF